MSEDYTYKKEHVNISRENIIVWTISITACLDWDKILA